MFFVKFKVVIPLVATVMVIPAIVIATTGTSEADQTSADSDHGQDFAPHVVSQEFSLLDATGPALVTVPCPTGERAVGGGVDLTDPAHHQVAGTFPTMDRTGWSGRITPAPANTSGSYRATVHAICSR